MTGLEILQDLYTCIKEPNALTGRAYRIIEKELEALEIIKKHMWLCDSSLSVIMDDLTDEEDFYRLKEILECKY